MRPFARQSHPVRMPRVISASAVSFLTGALLLANFVGSSEAKEWEIYRLGGRDYVSDENVAKFYRFHLTKEEKERRFTHPALVMTWTIGSQAIYVNDTKFNLSFPVIDSGGRALLSTVDLAKLVDPVLRPSQIKKFITFNTIVIDAGHGGHDSGAKGIQGYEKDYALDTANRLKKALEAKGFKTVMTRSNDTFLTLGQRVDIANRTRNAIFVSLHYNASGSRTGQGIETYALAPRGTRSTNGGNPWNSLLSGNERDAENIALATAVHAHIIDELRPIDRGIKRARFNVLRGINKPAILFEGGFITNPTESKLVHDPAHRQKIADSICNAVVNFKSAVSRRR
ncbi:MAG: N-acetylmuramoyl-L-alanine amidase [Verrucomicrobiales bacterium]|mgnify:FL=1|nr:N-acetylmuramoyl-L-alanine amidase [Verrucomicrobiales bacterium]